MKTKSFTNAHGQAKLDEIDRILHGQTSIYMNQDSDLLDASHNHGFSGNEKEWQSLHDLSVKLEDSLLHQNQSSDELIKQVECEIRDVTCLQTEETFINEFSMQTDKLPQMLVDSQGKESRSDASRLVPKGRTI